MNGSCFLVRIHSNLLYILSVVIASVSLVSCGGGGGRNLSRVIPMKDIRHLNTVIADAETYQQNKLAIADSIKSRLWEKDTIERVHSLIELSGLYRQLDSDSAIFYAGEANRIMPRIADDYTKTKAKLSLIDAFSTAGIFFEAAKIHDNIKPELLDLETRIEYWKTSRMLYSYSMAYLHSENDYADIYLRRYISCDDSLLKYLPKDDSFYQFINAERLVTQNKWEAAERALQQLLSTNPLESNIYGMSAYQMAEVYKNQGDFRNYIHYLTMAVESDVKGGVREGVALPTLANVLYEQGDLGDAFRYINFAIEEADDANLRTRTASIAGNMAMIDNTYKMRLVQSKNLMTGLFIAVLVLLLIVTVLSFSLFRNIRSARANEQKLSVTSRKLEVYVGNFIGLCSNYTKRIEQLTKLVTRKINAGQGADLLKLLNSGKFAEDDLEDFYRLFDKAILEIYPDFVKNINSLLLPDKQVIPDSTERLNPELRICACMKLGVEASTRIAHILNYSVNTVYSYRARMRNRAIDKENFENELRN